METAVFRKQLACKAFPRGTCKTFCFARLLFLIHTFVPTLFIPTLPTNVKECFREKTLVTNLESQRLLYPHISIHLLVDFPQLLPLHFNTIERLIVQTLTKPFQSVQLCFSAVGKHQKNPRMADAKWSLLGDSESQTKHGSKKPYWSRSLKGLSTMGRLGLEGLLLTHVSQLNVQWIDYHLEGGEEVLHRGLRSPLR